ncbi:MAG: ATP-dependent helicase [Gammaproteobacteria bacterium]|nr:ATP-dependent helicase [Gammaproteobacteria bacterium]
MEGHAIVAARRRAGYETELALEGEYAELQVRGRADGYDSAANLLEEFKTYRGHLERMPQNHRALHWAQVRIYGALLCRKRALQEIRLALVYFDIASERETTLIEHHSAESLESYFNAQCARFIDWARHETAHRTARDAALEALQFPFPDFHSGQRELAESAYRTVRRGGALLAQAPTGIGKTVGTIFPALKAMPAAGLDRLFYLSAKTPGRRLALDALARIEGSPPQRSLRVLELVAREKACENPDKECFGESCPLARGFYERLPAARAEAVERALLDQTSVREVARAHQICPYYLGQELMRWSDVVVGDYNYYFDSSAPLYALTTSYQWKVCVLVDEAHNLIERARKMYTASLERTTFDAVQFAAPIVLKTSLARVARAWNEMLDAQTEAYRAYEQVPEEFLGALERSVAAITDLVAEHPTALAAELEDFYFEAMHFCRLAAVLDEATLFDVTRSATAHGASDTGQQVTLCLRNVIPRRFLAPRWAATHAAVLFSATLSPPEFHLDVLGVPQDSRRIDVQSPFSSEQLSIRVVRSISTRWRHRAGSVQPIVRLMAEQFAARPGNYLAFFSSFDYLQQVAAGFEEQHPGIAAWRQERGMSEREREGFLSRFTPDGHGIGFAVLGGAFGEGIDLPGTRLIGAFIATLGLPQVSAVNEEMQRRMEARFGAGYEYTYLYPGLQKVVQAAGRVIRTTEDCGVVYLMDERFAQAGVRRLFPKWWKVESAWNRSRNV